MGSAGSIEGFTPLAGIQALTIIADNDASGTGRPPPKLARPRGSRPA